MADTTFVDRATAIQASWLNDVNTRVYKDTANVKQYGARGDGVTDDTAAFTAALAASDFVFLPQSTGAYIVGDLVVPSGKTIFSFSGTNYSTVNTHVIVRRKAGATNVFNINGKFNNMFAGFVIDGVDRTVNGISGGGNHTDLQFMTIRNCNFGIGDVNYCHTVKSIHTNFYGNNMGIRNPVDSIFIGGYVAANKNNGISCLTGSNDNQFIGLKLEWNENYGIDIVGGENIHVDAIFDRNFYAGAHIASTSTKIKITGEMRRNGRNDVAGQNAHVILDGTCSFVDIDVLTKTGADDGGGGPTTPQYCVNVITTSVTNVTIKGDLTGFVTAAFLNFSNLATVDVHAWGLEQTVVGKVNNADSLGNHYSKGSASINNAANANISLTLPSTSTFSRTYSKMEVMARNASSGATYAGTFNIVTSREAGSASLLKSAIMGEIGTAATIQFGAGTINLTTPVVATDGSSFTLNVANTVGATISFFVRMIP